MERIDEIKIIVGILMEVNQYYRLSDKLFVDSAMDVLGRCGLADDMRENALRAVVVSTYQGQKKLQADYIPYGSGKLEDVCLAGVL